MLEAVDVSVSFQGVKAVQHVSFAVEPGRIVGLIGPNGAGKTTLVNVLTGFQEPTTGSARMKSSIGSISPSMQRDRPGRLRSATSGGSASAGRSPCGLASC